MNPILFNVVSGAERTMYAQHARANNLANAETVGFRALMEFTTPQTVKGDGFEGSATTRSNIALNSFAVGRMMKTDRPLDVALNNRGFLTVQGKSGEPAELYTRAGELSVNDAGEVTISGRQVMTEQGPLILPEYQMLSISDEGIVSIMAPGEDDLAELAALKLVNPDYDQVTMDKSGLFKSVSNQALPPALDVTLRSGFLESSNVSPVEEMVGMMKLSRQFELQVKMMSTADSLAKASNQLLQV